MPFHAVLKDLVDTVPHAIGAIVVDWEGEAVQEFCHCDPDDLRFVAAHKGIVLARLRETNTDRQGGEIEDLVVTSECQIILIGVIDLDYSLVLQVERPCPVGFVRYHFCRALDRLKKEL